MKLIYGSTALKHWFPNYDKVPHDLDIICNTIKEENIKNSRDTEYYWIEAFNYLVENNIDTKYVDKNLLYTIKVSHAAWDVNWEKTIKDITFLKEKGCILDITFFNLLYNEWVQLHGKKNVKMSVYNSDFFKANIYRKFNHEELHERFKFYSRPLNESIREDLDSPLCSKLLWDKLSYENKLKCALEEVFVLASERFILVEKPIPTKFARVKILKQMIISSTSGWFNLFLIENFETLRTMEEEYFKQIVKTLRS